MSVIAIASIVTVLGAALGILLTHRLVGFRPDGTSIAAETVDADVAREISTLTARIDQMQAEIAQMHDRELRDDYKLEEVQKEVQQVREAALDFKTRVEARLGNLVKAWEQRERDLERLGRRHEREVEELALDRIERELHELTRYVQSEPEQAGSAR